MSVFIASSYSSDYPLQKKSFKGINIYDGSIPNRYKYTYETRPYQTFYRADVGTTIGAGAFSKCGAGTEITPKTTPLTNRPTPHYITYGKPIGYVSLIDNLNLRQAPSTFYNS